MNFKQLVKIALCTFVLSLIFVNVGAASVSSEMQKYDTANEKQFMQLEKSFKCQYSQFAGTKNVIVISMSANFENSNCVRHFTVLENAKLRLTDYKGRTETVSVKELQNKYECYMMAKAPKTFDTSGALSSNFNALKV
jgi:hypothetical protein